MNRFWARQRTQSDERGYTLVEILVVVVIIGILALIATAAYGSVSDRSRAAACLSNQRTLSTALSVYKNDHAGVISATFTVDELSIYANTWRRVSVCPLDATPLTYDAASQRIECPNHPIP